MRIALVTYSKEPNLSEIDRGLIPIFKGAGIKAIPAVWNDANIEWSEFDLLILRSVWDYHLHSASFLMWLDHLDHAKIPLLNPTSIIRRNHHKFYLVELEHADIPVVPTIFISNSDHLNLQAVKEKNWQKAVIKPAISASSFLTEVFDIDKIDNIQDKYSSYAKDRDFLVQEFMPEVQTFGELSLLFFNRKYSHTVLKTAKKDEFRVQSEYGGTTTSYSPSTTIIEQASNVLSKFEGNILQARVDGVIRNGVFILMEIELIEPHLFFEMKEESKNLFVNEAIELFHNRS